MLDLVAAILQANNLKHGHYAEPFAGGCGLALSLLYGGHVAEIHINDLDPAIWAFWNSVINDTKNFASIVSKTPVTIREWHRQREIFARQEMDDPLTLGFSAFFLNRTNRSGVIKGGGAIGGLDQTGNYKIACRYNVEDLVRRIQRVSRYKDRIHLSNDDAIVFLKKCRSIKDHSLAFIDPPYFKKGPGLYTSFYKPHDHADLSKHVLAYSGPWIVTYDDVPEIRNLYRDRRQFSFDIAYSLNEKRTGNELLIASKGLRMPESARDRQVSKPQYRHAA